MMVKAATAAHRKQRHATLRDQYEHASSIENRTPPMGAPNAACHALKPVMLCKLNETDSADIGAAMPPQRCIQRNAGLPLPSLASQWVSNLGSTMPYN